MNNLTSYKLLAAMKILKDLGWDCVLLHRQQQWAVWVRYIDQGPLFDYTVTIDQAALRDPDIDPETLAGMVTREALAAMEVC